MRTEVYINNLLFDLDDETTLAASYGNISFGELNKRKGIKSTQFEGPFSERNKLIAESCEVQGSYSLVPYRKNTIRVEIDGVINFEGFCVFEESGDGYQVQSFAGASDFYSIITNTKLAELDLSAYSHVWNESNIRSSWTQTSGYVYAFVEYGKNWPSFSNFPPDNLLPQIFFHTVIRQIAIDAGYILMGDVLNNPRFQKHIIIPNVFPTPIMYGGTWDLATLLPDLTQSKYWLDFANMYGLQFDINEVTKEIRANYIDDILFNEPEDWSVKIDKTEKPKTKYKIENTFQKSYFRYKSEPYNPAKASGDAFVDFAKEVIIDDETLPLSGDVYKSECFLIQNSIDPLFPPNSVNTITFLRKESFFYGIWRVGDGYVSTGIVWHNGTYYKAEQNSTGQAPPANLDYWKPIKESEGWEIKLRPMYGALWIFTGSTQKVEFPTTEEFVTRIISNIDMEWGYSYTHHYRIFNRIIDHTKVVRALMKLTYSDINQLNFARGKVINNELYFLEEVDQYKLNETDSTTVQLVRI